MNNWSWAVKEMKKGLAIRRKSWIKGIYYFSEGDRIYMVNMTFAKENRHCTENVVYFLSEFESKDWISKNIKI